MTINATMHGFKSLKAHQSSNITWLEICGERSLETIVVFMPLRLAEMIEEAFHAYEDWESGQEGPAFDDALAAKCDADARVEEARALK